MELKELNNNISNLQIKRVVAKDNYIAEKIFQDREAKGLVANDIIREVKKNINNSREIEHKQYISYQSVKNINSEYFLLRAGKDFIPLKNYLDNNQLNINTIVNWWQTVLGLFSLANKLNLNWTSIIPESLWVNKQGELFIVDPFVTEKIVQYRTSLELNFNHSLLKPPEVLNQNSWHAKGQLYSISSFFYYLITNKPLFEGKDNEELIAKIKKIKPLTPQIINSNISSELNQLLMNCLAKNLKKRPSGLVELKVQLEELKVKQRLLATKNEKQKIKTQQKRAKTIFSWKENIFWFFYQYARLAIGIVGVLVLLAIFISTSGYKKTVDQNTSSKQVVKYFYQAIDNRDINLLKEINNSEQLSHIKRMVLHEYIIGKAKNLFSSPPPSARKSTQELKEESNKRKKNSKASFKITNLKITQLTNNSEPKYKVSYNFVFIEQSKKAVVNMNDRLVLNRINNKWKIEKISGDIARQEFLRKKDKKLKGK